MTQPILIHFIVILLLLPSSAKLHASIVIENTRIIYSANMREATVRLTNYSKKPVLVQSWLDSGDPTISPAATSTPFILTPPIFRVDGERGHTLRIHLLDPAALPGDREAVYWINVLDIPLKPPVSRTEDLMMVALRSRIKLFYRPVGLKGSPGQAVSQLRWRHTKDGITAVNPSPWHISLTSIMTAVSVFPAEMISPASQHTFRLKINAGTPFQFTWLDDYGVLHTHQAVME